MDAVMLIMAAGEGARMRSATPKVLHPICGLPMISWVVEAAKSADLAKVVVVLGPDSPVAEVLPEDVDVAIQAEPLGTGDAVAAARGSLDGMDSVLVLSGDCPLITAQDLKELVASHEASGAAATMATAELEDPTGYGRVVRAADRTLERVAETKAEGDASAGELKIREVNGGIYVFQAEPLMGVLDSLRPDNAQGELYLPDALPVFKERGNTVNLHRLDDPSPILGVNTRVDLARVQAVCQKRILERHMLDGVTVADPQSTVIDVGVEMGNDVVVEPFTLIRGCTQVAPGAVIGPFTTLIDTAVGAESRVVHSYLNNCKVLDRCTVGPFAYIRPETILREGAKAGTFVEIKNSDVGSGTKVPHLSYVGDATIGEGTNIGAGNITANYDGFRKHRTVIGDRVRTGVDTALVAPVSVGSEAYTGAGSVITEDVPEGALGISRSDQQNVEGYARRKEKESDD